MYAQEYSMKGIIVAAGYGTRFLPVTKTIPKEMLPLIDKPSIAFIIEEFIASGIRDILIITSRRKKALEDYLDREMELEELFKREGKTGNLEKIKPYDAKFFFIRQQEMLGTGHALLLAKDFAGTDPCIVAYPDDLHFGEKPLAKQLIESWEKTGCSVLAGIHDPPNINRYGVLALAGDGLHVKDIIEKPPVGEEPSREATIGRYLYTADFFEFLEEGWKKHGTGEYYHTYGLKKLMDLNRVVYKRTEGLRLDTGEPSGYLEALIRYAAETPEYRKIIIDQARRLQPSQDSGKPQRTYLA